MYGWYFKIEFFQARIPFENLYHLIHFKIFEQIIFFVFYGVSFYGFCLNIYVCGDSAAIIKIELLQNFCW